MLLAWPFFAVAAGLAALYAWRYNAGLVSPTRTWIKTGSVVLLAVAALIGDAPPLLVIGLLACAVGDAFLAQDGQRALILGMGAFFVGQLVYIVLLLIEGGAMFANVFEGGVQALLAAAAVFLYWLWPRLGDMAMPVAAYGLALTIMALLAVGLPGFALVAVGALLFYFSDGVLAFEMFATEAGDRQRLWTRPTVWALYWGGQALITAGFLTPVV